MSANITKNEIKELLLTKAQVQFGQAFADLDLEHRYFVVCYVVNDILTEKRVAFKKRVLKQNLKKVYYMSMEFLLGRSLRNHLYNLGLDKNFTQVLEELHTDINAIYELEPDAGLGNGGLGRLAAAYLESLTNLNYSASGFCIKYDFGIFRQKIVEGWQTELPDDWLPRGHVWLNQRLSDSFKVKFGGKVEQYWDNGKLKINHVNADVIIAQPYDMNISGFNTSSVNRLRLWHPVSSQDFDLQLFSTGQYVQSLQNKAMAESISKVLYPADNHIEGKSLRLKQQYFFVSASVQSIVAHHLKANKSLDNLGEKVAIHINDTHPTLCIPELMRILLDEYEYDWDSAWKIVCETISYTNHTVMAEALEKWPLDLFQRLLPRIYQIVEEINRRLCGLLWGKYPGDGNKVAYNAILSDNQVKMANICLAASYKVNGVSALHSEILKHDIFKDYYNIFPEKFDNVTNGITYRRWIAQANPLLDNFIQDLIGDSYLKDAMKLKDLEQFKGNLSVLNRLGEIKHKNKERLAKYIFDSNGVVVNPDSIFDVQIKRLHEYKRQLLNAIHILYLYRRIKEDRTFKIEPRTFIFGAKAAASYYMAKQIIRFICKLGDMINNDPDVNGMIKVVFLENYRISLSELIIPGSDISEQISIAGKEASGTGNMKFMANGAITLGTMDGANVEISELVGDENIVIFGMLVEEVEKLYRDGYHPTYFYNDNKYIQNIIQDLRNGIAGHKFTEIADSLLVGANFSQPDPYMVLADFESYRNAQERINDIYRDKERFYRMSLMNIANSGFFSSDRSIEEYAERIWKLDKVK